MFSVHCDLLKSVPFFLKHSVYLFEMHINGLDLQWRMEYTLEILFLVENETVFSWNLFLI